MNISASEAVFEGVEQNEPTMFMLWCVIRSVSSIQTQNWRRSVFSKMLLTAFMRHT